MKKYLPVILFVVGLLVVGGALFFFLRGKKSTDTSMADNEKAILDVPLAQRPYTTLTPTADGHWLTLDITKLQIDAASLDYELLYKLPDGRTQGVPGTIDLKGETSIERKLLLGSESSGKFRYDEGVKNGTLTLRFRNDKGQLLAKFQTEFNLLSDTKELASSDGNFKATLSTVPTKGFFVTMQTFGLPAEAPGDVTSGPYGLFASSSTSYKATVDISGTPYYYNGTKWESIPSSITSGVFIGTAASQ